MAGSLLLVAISSTCFSSSGNRSVSVSNVSLERIIHSLINPAASRCPNVCFLEATDQP